MKRGFTLLELIVVIIIIGILATLGTAQYTSTIERGRRAEAASVLSTMRTQAVIWNLEGDHATTYPGAANISSLLGLPTASSCDTSYYFWYSMNSTTGMGTATRCTTGGKSPNQTGTAEILTLSIDGVKGSTPSDLW